MSFTLLAQKEYVDDQGHPVLATTVEIAPYTHIADGFYKWECGSGSCRALHASRSCGWPVAGQVLRCEKCGTLNLLVKTNVKELDECFGMKIRLEEDSSALKREQEAFYQLIERSARQKLQHLLPVLDKLVEEIRHTLAQQT